MFLACKCDRCGSFYSPESRRSKREEGFNAITLINRTFINGTYSNGTYDLCPNCSNSFLEWLNACNLKEA